MTPKKYKQSKDKKIQQHNIKIHKLFMSQKNTQDATTLNTSSVKMYVPS